MALYCIVEESRKHASSVGEVEKGDLLMVSLEWMMYIVGGIHC
jgi:hypothetical protein